MSPIPYRALLQYAATDQCVAQAGVDVSKHGGHAYPGMEKVYNEDLFVREDSAHGSTFKGSDGIAYMNGNGAHTSGDSVLRARVRLLVDRKERNIKAHTRQMI